MLHAPLLRVLMATFAEEGNMRAGVSCFTFHRTFSGLDWMLGFWLFLVVCWFLGRLLFFVWLCFVMPIQYQDHRVYHDFVGISKTATVVTMSSKGSKKKRSSCALAGILDQVHVNRLMYVKRLVAQGPPILWQPFSEGVVTTAAAILSLVLQAFSWCASLVGSEFSTGMDFFWIKLGAGVSRR